MFQLRSLMLALLALVPTLAHAVDIDGCGQTVPPGETGVLTADLAFCDSAVLLEEGAKLQLNGHTISDSEVGVDVRGRRFDVSGPGVIARNDYGVSQGNGRRKTCTLDNIDFHDNEYTAVATLTAKVIATNLTVTGNGAENGYGLAVEMLIGTNLTVTDNPGIGVAFRRSSRLINSTVIGNNSTRWGVDILTSRRPRLIDTTCGKSAGKKPRPPVFSVVGVPWGVCLND